MYKIILIGLVRNHHTLYSSLLKLLKSNFDNITFLSYQDIVNQMDDCALSGKINVVTDEGCVNKVIKRNIKQINNYDILLLDEVFDRFFRLASIKFKNKKKVFIFHNSNRWLLPKLRFNLKFLFDQLFRKYSFNKFDAYITMGPNIVKYLAVFQINKPIFFHPFDSMLNNSQLKVQHSKKNDKIVITIPGAITEKRRNYKELLAFLKQYYTNNPSSKIQVKLLGRLLKEEVDIQKMITQINDINNEKVIYWEKFIPIEEFEREIINADFVLSNIHVFNNFYDRMEIYGITKESGISFIIYKYAKVGIVPASQNILSGFDSQLIKYNDYTDLVQIFNNICEGKIDYKSLVNNALNNRQCFNKIEGKENIKLLEYLKK